MTAKSNSQSPTHFVAAIFPWLLAMVMFAIYLFTLDHWVQPDRLRIVENFAGLDWRPDFEQFFPVTYLLTYPFRWLPAHLLPLPLALFSAACAAFVLVSLARTVTLWPHDRTRQQGERFFREASPLATWSAWLPPFFAVLVCGLQLSFWQNAVSVSGEMVDLLLFAWMVRCLVEFRLDKNERWLRRLAFLNGLAVANNWAMLAYLPAFLVMLAWLKGWFGFFNARFFHRLIKEKFHALDLRLPARLLGWWLAGLALILLMPLVAGWSHNGHVSFPLALRAVLRWYKTVVTNPPFRLMLTLSVTSVVPVLFISIPWGRFLGANQPWAKFISKSALYLVHGFFLAACLWTVLDSPFSPRWQMPAFACLPLYYLTALSIGCLSGYFLVNFSAKPPRPGSHQNQLNSPAWHLNYVLVGLVWALAIVAPVLLVYKNLPEMRRRNDGILAGYSSALESSLPPAGAVIFSDDAFRLRCLESILLQHRKLSEYVLIDPNLMAAEPEYLQFLARKNPSLLGTNQATRLNSTEALHQLLDQLSRARELYSLTASFGAVGEFYHAEPNALLYWLRPNPANTWTNPPLPSSALADARIFWGKMAGREFPALIERTQKRPAAAPNILQRILNAAHIEPEPDRIAIAVTRCYSSALDHLGVELQQAGMLPEAENYFAQARQLNPANAAAQINEQCNQQLQARRPVEIVPFKQLESKLGTHVDWYQVLRQDGPVDDPVVCYRVGSMFVTDGLSRQGVQELERAKALASQFLSLESTNTKARLMRAEAALALGQLPEARQDYEKLVPTPDAYLGYYGLAQIEFRRGNAADEIKYGELCLASAPPNSSQAQNVKARLKLLKSTAPEH